jgi:ADP-heptose:LPS heptosyltransferase
VDLPRFQVPPFEAEGVISRLPASPMDPDRMVVIRLHAFGDVAITFPVLSALRRRLPRVRLTVVTDPRNADLVRPHAGVNAVISADARSSRSGRLARVLSAATRLRLEGRSVVLDLQRNEISRAITQLVAPRAFSAFDRFAPRIALSRDLEPAEALGFRGLAPVLAPHGSEGGIVSARERLTALGAAPGRPIACLNPAGRWETKQWPLDRYVEAGRRLGDRGWQLLALGSRSVSPRHAALREALGPSLIDLSGQTSASEALALVALSSLVISDNSGLMHLAWVQGVPAIALFESSRSTWSRPEGPGSSGFYSEDLPCGACMQPSCTREDRHCLVRVSVDDVLERISPPRVLAAGLAPREAS